MRVLFVCTGNTCRSPMAEGYLKTKGITAFSRGLCADGSAVSPNSKEAMAETGVDISGHISKQLTAVDLSEADKIICMSHSHRAALLGVACDKEITVLGGGVSDPYGGDIAAYRACRDQIINELDRLLDSGFFADYRVVSAEDEHIKGIAEIEAVTFAEPWSENVIAQAMKGGTDFFVAVDAEKRVLGYVGISAVCGEGYIANIAVRSDSRLMGIGTALMNRIMDFANENGLEFVSLEVRASNQKALSLYEKFGFVQEGRRKGFYNNPKEDALIMTKRFEEK
ncbi:MAG: ribosomal protein S18-alanine N-acetyltransferase [Clostridia bacterium]|nr:ribosomal protein S18-alanine N-acetyltransferase [Clostridia bacterium]